MGKQYLPLASDIKYSFHSNELVFPLPDFLSFSVFSVMTDMFCRGSYVNFRRAVDFVNLLAGPIVEAGLRCSCLAISELYCMPINEFENGEADYMLSLSSSVFFISTPQRNDEGVVLAQNLITSPEGPTIKKK